MASMALALAGDKQKLRHYSLVKAAVGVVSIGAYQLGELLAYIGSVTHQYLGCRVAIEHLDAVLLQVFTYIALTAAYAAC